MNYVNNFNPNMMGLAGGLLVFFAIIFCVIFIWLLVLYIVGRWKFYEKTGREGWKSIIPFYNDWVYVEIAGLNSWYFLLLIANAISFSTNINDDVHISFNAFKLVALVGLFFCNYNISKKLHKDPVYAALMTIFPFVMLPIIGFSKKIEFDDSVLVSPNGPIDDINARNKNNQNTSSNVGEEDDVKKLQEEKKEIEKRIKKLKEEAKNEEKKDDTVKAKEDVNNKFCVHCGAKIESGNKFCGNCGKEI